MISFLLSAATGFFSYSALSKKTCTFKDSATFTFDIFCYVLLAFAVINIVFAIYFQTAVWSKIKNIIKQDFDEKQTTTDTVDSSEVGESYASKMKKQGGGLLAQGRAQLGAAGAAEQQEVSEEAAEEVTHKVKANVVQDGFKKTFMEDFGVLVFFFASFGDLVMCLMARSEIKDSCKPSEYEGWANSTGMGFFVIPASYSFLWYCCACCAKSVPINGKDLNELTIGAGSAE